MKKDNKCKLITLFKHMEEDTKRKLVFIALIAIAIILGRLYILDTSNKQSKEFLDNYQVQDTVQTVVFDSIYRHHMHDYTIDVLKCTKRDYTKLIFRNDKEPDSFVVNVYPMNDFNEYESDVIQRFIDVHEHEKLTNYEYVHKSDGTVVQKEIVPLTKEFNISIVHRAVPDNGKMVTKAFIRRNKYSNPTFEVLIKLED